MDINCEKCKGRFKIPDDKIPPDKTVYATCPKCRHKISINAKPRQTLQPGDDDLLSEPLISEESFDPYDEPFDFVEEEGQTALICEQDSHLKSIFKNALVTLEYHTSEADSIRDALTKMRFHTYDLIVVNEKFDSESPVGNSVLVHLERLPMALRRNIFVTLITNQYRTMDHMAAFHKSVNLIVNSKNAVEFDGILKKAVLESALFFKIYKEMMKETGKS